MSIFNTTSLKGAAAVVAVALGQLSAPAAQPSGGAADLSGLVA